MQENCQSCAAPRDPAALDWVLDRTEGDAGWLCPECARRHIRDIEAKLSRDWW